MDEVNKKMESASVSGSSGGVGNKPPVKKKTNKVKADARSKFNPSAPSISAEKYFSDFIEKKRNNVEIIFDTEVLGRVADPYIAKAATHAKNKHLDVTDDLARSTHALISLTLCRKLLLSIPDSEEYEMGRFKEIGRTQFMAPKSVIAVAANIGKFEYDDKVARLKYASQDIFRMFMTMCKVMSGHSDYEGKYAPPVMETTWDALDVNKLVIVSESSVRWLRDEAINFLNRAYLVDWDVVYYPPPTDDDPNPEGIPMKSTYPRLKIVDDPDKQLENVVEWIGKLNQHMPGIQYVIAAGFATAWKLLFFQRVGHLFRNLVRGLPDWIGNRPIDVLTTLGLHLCEIATDDYDGTSYVGFIMEIFRHVNLNTTVFAEFLELAKQPDDKFGSAAQMLPFTDADFRDATFIGLDDYSYRKLRADAQSIAVTKIKDKGLATLGLTFAFAKKVVVVDNYIGRLNGDPNNVRTQYLKPDLRYYS